MPVDSLTFTHHATRRGAPLPKMYGPVLRPREPVDRREPSHQTWFVGDAGGMVGALLVDDALLVATGAEGRAWTVEPDGRVAELTLETGTPPEVAVPDPARAAHERARADALASLRFARVQPAAGRRVALTDGLSFATHNTEALGRLLRGPPAALADAAAPPPAPGLLRRMLGARAAPRGVALVLDCVAEAHAPAGLTPWLRALERRGLQLDWMGNEAGNHPLRLLERPATGDVHGAMLQLAREELPRDGAEVWEDWSALQRERGAPRAGAGFQELVVGAPERGWWRDADEEELAANLEARAAEYSARGTPDARLVWSRHVAGDELLARVRAAVERLVALAIFDVPDEECVVVWYLLGGRSRASGQLELVALERVWS